MSSGLLEIGGHATKDVICTGLRGSSGACLIAELAENRPLCCIVADEHLLPVMEQDIDLFSSLKILPYPGYEIPPYTPLSPDQRTTATRYASLYRMREGGGEIMITSIEAMLRRIMPLTMLTGCVEYVVAGEDCDRDELLTRIVALGYEQVSLVQGVGDFSVRGGIIDLYPPPFALDNGQWHEGPLRLDFFGDTVESVKPFDPYSQRSSGEIPEAVLLPVSDILMGAEPDGRMRKITNNILQLGEAGNWNSAETARMVEMIATGRRFPGMEFFLPLFYFGDSPATATVFDFLPANTAIVQLAPEAVTQAMGLYLERIETNYQLARQKGTPALPPQDIFLSKEEFTHRLATFPTYRISDFPELQQQTVTFNTKSHTLLRHDIQLHRKEQGLLSPLCRQIRHWQQSGDMVVVCCRSSRHMRNLRELFTKQHFAITELQPPFSRTTLVPEQEDTLFLLDHPLASGFSLPDHRLHLLSESELFGEMRLGGKSKRKVNKETISFNELNEGDIVVHRDHGLGFYRGLTTIEFQGIINDFLLLEYKDGDKLYLPVDRLNLITRYQGLSDREPRIDKLGTQTWKTTKSKVKEEVWKVAQELLDIYARREIREGRSFSPPGPLYNELEESFAYDETPGQAGSINDVLADLASDRPMDRLVCGDVGYGKTEVAVRAAFKVIEDGYQVAVLVPTTVLAEQHAKTFSERFSGFPVNVRCLNRFRSTAEQRGIIKELEKGGVDILIGTHRLLSKDVRFKKLGLVIIDEEHRFGVAHKEKLKKIRAEVDVLTLTATPIPRTLQMSLLNIRDLSVIATPPEHRQPVKTFVARYDDLVIKEAVSRELRRGGQVFVVHNRVRSIQQMAATVGRLVPEAKIAVAHGQMAGKDLEEIMVAFVNKEINVLVSTTIIESGLDIPSANTIIINRADMLGLAEIYQLRGRVGRSAVQSYAYLLVPSLDSLSKDSRERLKALMDYNELGGGFKLAMSDLQIRGGGNLLGVSQSGNIAAIGYDLYLDLLQKTVADLKAKEGRQQRIDIDPEINLKVSAYIPDAYISDIKQRYITYRRIAALTEETEETRLDLQEEMIDRYGPLPAETIALLRIIALKKPLTQLHISKVEQGRDTLVFSFLDTTPLAPQRLMDYLQAAQTRKKPQKKLTPDGRLVVAAELDSVEQVFSAIEQTIGELTGLLD
jgi:transcription-repair coupling factor (superfamily II helicase)